MMRHRLHQLGQWIDSIRGSTVSYDLEAFEGVAGRVNSAEPEIEPLDVEPQASQ